MSESPPPRQPFGYGKTAPARPKPQPQPVAKAPPQPQFEVVEEEDPGFEVVDEKPQAKKALIVPKKEAREEPDERDDRDPEPEKPKRKRKKQKTRKYSDKLIEQVDEEQKSRDAALRDYEWVFPLVVLAIGMVMMFVGAFGASTLAGLATFFYICVFLIVAVPLIILGFMLVGMLVGIDYGRIGPAILKIAAVTCVANGIMCIGAWMKLPAFVVFPISCFITFGVFMTLFDLDTWEANVSAGVVNVCSFLANIALFAFVVVAASSAGGGKDTDPDEDKPVETRKDRKRDRDPGNNNPGNPPVFNGGDNDDD